MLTAVSAQQDGNIRKKRDSGEPCKSGPYVPAPGLATIVWTLRSELREAEVEKSRQAGSGQVRFEGKDPEPPLGVMPTRTVT